MRYKLLIFDFDGTLADTFTWFVANINRAAQKYGFEPIAPGSLESLRNTDALTLLRDHGIPGWKVPLIAGYMRKLMAQNLGGIRLFPGMGAVLEQLAGSSALLAVVSSNARSNILAVLGPYSRLFTSYECGVGLSGKESKIKKVLRATKTSPAEAILIGDEIRDGIASRKAGVAFGAVTWGYNSAMALKALQPEFLFEEVGEFAGMAGD